MKTTLPLFKDKARLLYKEFDHYTPNGNAIYLYIFERLERLDENNLWKPYGHFASCKMKGDDQSPNTHAGEHYIIEYTRKNKNSWDFKLLSIQ